MEKIHFEEAVEEILTKDERYKPDGYEFLRRALDSTIKAVKDDELEELRHVSGPDLLEGMIKLGLDELGVMAVAVFDSWGIRTGEDVGNMVFNLIDVGAFGQSEEDSRDDFVGVVDMKERLTRPYRPTRPVLAENDEDSEPPARGNQPARPSEI